MAPYVLTAMLGSLKIVFTCHAALPRNFVAMLLNIYRCASLPKTEQQAMPYTMFRDFAPKLSQRLHSPQIYVVLSWFHLPSRLEWPRLPPVCSIPLPVRTCTVMAFHGLISAMAKREGASDHMHKVFQEPQECGSMFYVHP